MTRLPPLFFLGLFPVVILLWAWADSVAYQTSWKVGRQDKYSHTAMVRSCALTLTRLEFNPALSPDELNGCHINVSKNPLGRFNRREISARPPLTLERIFPAPEKDQHLTPSPQNYFLESNYSIPLWLILLAYQPLWLGLSFWQACHRQAKLRSSLP